MVVEYIPLAPFFNPNLQEPATPRLTEICAAVLVLPNLPKLLQVSDSLLKNKTSFQVIQRAVQ